MRKNYLTLLITIIAIQNTFGQFGPEQIIGLGMQSATTVFADDMDGDGDIDVLASASGIDTLAWYENIDGQGSFSSENIISTTADGAHSIFTADLDNDGDNDVINASLYGDGMYWFKNTDGQGNFLFQFIENGVADYGVWWVHPGDVDNDGDLDLLYCYAYDDKIVWFENVDGLGGFGEQQIITEEAQRPTSVYFCDLDGDGDLDIVSASLLDDKIAWYENINGQGDFGIQQIISTSGDGAISVFPIDIDGDGDLDVISSSIEDNKVAWYENLNGNGDFGDEQVLLTDLEHPRMVYSNDLDEDGDMDILVAFSDDDKIVWFENLNGLGSFGTQQTISENADGASSVYTADIDGDGDQDILSSSWNDGKIAWYENLTPLSVNDNSIPEFDVYPNPTDGTIFISSKSIVSQLDIYNSLGQIMLNISNRNEVDISHLSIGLYYVKIKFENGASGYKKIIKQ